VNTAPNDAHDLGPFFEPALREACKGALNEIRWFRTAWQRGGAATAYTTYEHEGSLRDAVVKFPVGPREYKLLTGLAGECNATPNVAFHGTELGSAEMAWVVMERLPGDPIKSTAGDVPKKQTFAAIAQAAASFYETTLKKWPIEKPPKQWPWQDLIERSRQSTLDNPLPNAPRWKAAIKDVSRALTQLVNIWESRDINTFCHGDLHLANIMTRSNDSTWTNINTDADRLVLVDFGEVHEGHWIEDAVYLERIYWANPAVSKAVKFVPLFARARKELGLDCSDDYNTLAHVRRTLMAACAPAWLHREAHPQYLDAALNMLERSLPLTLRTLSAAS